MLPSVQDRRSDGYGLRSIGIVALRWIAEKYPNLATRNDRRTDRQENLDVEQRDMAETSGTYDLWTPGSAQRVIPMRMA